MKDLMLFIFILGSTYFIPVSAQNYIIDESHSAVLMKVQRFGVVHVIGRFGEIEGSIAFNPDDPSATKADIAVTVASYTANNAGGEASAKSSAFLDGENHPELVLLFKEVEESEGKLKVTADLTIKGVTKEEIFYASVVGPKMDLPTRKQSVALSGSLNIKRLDYGVGPDKTLPDGTEIIGNEVSIVMEFLGISE